MPEYSIQPLIEVHLAPSTIQLLEEVDSRRKELLACGPMTQEQVTQLQRALLPDRIVATLNMESIWVTRRQTLAVMDALRVGEQAGDSEAEIANALSAHEFVLSVAGQRERLSLGLMREINRHILQGLRADAGGYELETFDYPERRMFRRLAQRSSRSSTRLSQSSIERRTRTRC
jgi:hypothetical protein